MLAKWKLKKYGGKKKHWNRHAVLKMPPQRPKKDKPTDTSLADFDHLNQQTPDVTLIEKRHS